MYGAYVSTVNSVVYIYGKGVNFEFDGANISDGPSLIGDPEAIQGYTESGGNIYLIQADGVVLVSSGGGFSSHATDIFIEPIYSFATFSGTAYRDWETDRKSTRLNSSHSAKSRMPSSA